MSSPSSTRGAVGCHGLRPARAKDFRVTRICDGVFLDPNLDVLKISAASEGIFGEGPSCQKQVYVAVDEAREDSAPVEVLDSGA